MSVTKESVTRLMKRCQIGCGGRNGLDDAHDILAECYGTLGALVQERDALQARIDGAANVTARVGYHGGCMLYGPEELAGKRVALVPLDD